MFWNVSKVVLRGKRNTFATLSEDVWQFSWQAWDLVTSTFVSGGKRGTSGTGLALVAGLAPSGRRGRRGSLRGRRGTRRHGRASCVAGVHLGASAAANAIAALKIQKKCSRNRVRACLRPMHTYIHACIHTYIHTYIQTDQTRPYQTIPDHTRTY